MIGRSAVFLHDSARVQDEEVEACPGEHRQQLEDLPRVVVTGAHLHREGPVNRLAQALEDLRQALGGLEHAAAGQSGAHAAEGTSHVEVDMDGAGILSREGGGHQRLRLMADQLHDQGGSPAVAGHLQQVALRQAPPGRAVDAYELGEESIGTDPVGEKGAQRPVGHPLHGGEHQRRCTLLPGQAPWGREGHGASTSCNSRSRRAFSSALRTATRK